MIWDPNYLSPNTPQRGTALLALSIRCRKLGEAQRIWVLSVTEKEALPLEGGGEPSDNRQDSLLWVYDRRVCPREISRGRRPEERSISGACRG